MTISKKKRCCILHLQQKEMRQPEIFIVGAPRSGTTLLRNILNRHPKLAICGETQFFHHVYARRRAFGDLLNTKNRRCLVAKYLPTDRIRRLGMDSAGLSERLMSEGTSYQAFFSALLAYYAQSQGKSRFGEKTPQHAQYTEILCEWYPGAKILHMLRDPRDVVESLQRMAWASNSILTNARVWLQNNLAAVRSSSRPGYLLVRYETLVEQPERELTRICAHLGEDYSPLMLTLNEERTKFSSWSKRSRLPVTTERLGKWREELDSDSVRLIEWVLGDHMAAFGYPRTTASPSPAAIARSLGLAAWDFFQQRVSHFPAGLYRLIQPRNLTKEEFWVYRGLRNDNP